MFYSGMIHRILNIGFNTESYCFRSYTRHADFCVVELPFQLL